MKKITKSLMALALLVSGAVSVNAQTDNCATFENPTKTNAEWNKDTQSFTWGAPTWNQIHNIGLLEDESGPSDISDLKNLTIDYEIISGNGFRVLFYLGGSNIAIYINANGAYRDNGFTDLLAETVGEEEVAGGVVEIPIYDFLTGAGASFDYFLKLTDICLSGFGDSGEVKVNSMCVDTYGPGEKPTVEEEEDEVDPGWPAGDFIDFTEAFPELQPRINIGDDGHPIVLGQGEIVVGAKSQNVIADLSAYSELTIVTTPGLKLVVYMNHEVATQETADGYSESDAGLYEFIEVQADEDGIITIDLTQFDKQDLNCICLPWDNSNRGTVWYLLLTENNDPLVKFKKDLKNMIAQVEMVNPIGKTAESFNALQSALLAAQSELESVSATEASLTSALQSLEAAVLDLKYAAGFAKLTDDMFMEWDDAENPFIGTAIPGAYEMFSSTGMVYGDPSVIYTHFTDLTPFDYLYIAATEGTPRVIFNRAEPIDPSEEGYDDHGGAYEQKNEEPEDGLVTIDLKALEAGYAHLNAIKGYNGNTTVTELLVYAENSVINVGPSGYASYSGILNVELTDNDLTAYAATYADGQLTLTPISVIPADEAVIVKSNVEIEGDVLGFTYPNIESADEIENDLLISDGSVQGNGSIYALGQVDGVVGFYRMAENEVVPNGKAYLFLPDEARAFIALNGTVNGISEMAANRGTENKSIFNLAGQRVVKAQKGLYIQNGKKVVKN